MRRLVFGIAALVVLVSGCTPIPGGDVLSPPPEAGTVDAKEPRQESSDEATTGQWASVIAGSERAIMEAVSEAELHNCAAPADEDGEFFCDVALTMVEISAKELRGNLDSSMKETSVRYLGAPPQEIEQLVASTRTAAADTVDAIHAIAKCADADCMGEYMLAMASIKGLKSAIDSWAPYK